MSEMGGITCGVARTGQGGQVGRGDQRARRMNYEVRFKPFDTAVGRAGECRLRREGGGIDKIGGRVVRSNNISGCAM